MLCEDVIEQLSAYLDSELTAEESEAVRAHVAACERCRAELKALDRTVHAVADLPRLRAPSGLRDQVMAKLDRTAPAEARHPRWRMYWGAAAAVAFAVVIMLLTKTTAGPRRTELEAAAPAPKNVPGGEIALAKRGGGAGGGGAGERFLRKAANSEQDKGGVAGYLEAQPPAFETAQRAPVSGGQIAFVMPVLSEQIVLPSANPQAAYSRAVSVATKGGWLPSEQQKRTADGVSPNSGEAEQSAQGQVLQLVFRIKRGQMPLLKNALAAAGLQAAEEKGGRDEKAQLAAQPTYQGAPQLAFAPAARREMNIASNAASAETRFGLQDRGAAQIPAAYATAPGAIKAPEAAAGAAVAGFQQPMAQKQSQGTEVTALDQTQKTEAVEEPFVQVTLLFPLGESAVPAGLPAAEAANSASPE